MDTIKIPRSLLFNSHAVKWTRGNVSALQNDMLHDSPTVRLGDMAVSLGDGTLLVASLRHDTQSGETEVSPSWSGAIYQEEGTLSLVRYVPANEIEFA